jgi:S1-C subfamily serine protease
LGLRPASGTIADGQEIILSIRRIPLLLVALAFLAPVARPAEPNPEVVKAVRAMLSAKREEERDELKAALLKREDLDWASLKAGLEAGPFYQKPLDTAYGLRGSNKHFDIVYSGADGTPRGFLLYVPKTYAAEPTPLIVYLHDSPQDPQIGQGGNRAESAVSRFKKMCEDSGVLFVAPYTSKGAEWWTEEGRKLVAWTLRRIRERYNVDDDRVALLGALGGGDAVWYLGQEMPSTWSVLMPMSGDPYEISAMIRPLFLGTLDRMDILMGVPAKTSSTVGEKDIPAFLGEMKPMFGQRLRITAAIWPTAQGDFSYLEDIAAQIASFAKDRKRKGYADEVDVETEEGEGLRSLWLRNDGYDADGAVAAGHHSFQSTHLKWTAPAAQEPEKKAGIDLHPRTGLPGLVVNATPGEAKNSQIFQGDIVLEVDGAPVSTIDEFKAALQKREWNEEARLLLARDVKESDLAKHEKIEARYARYRKAIEEANAQGKPAPTWGEMAEEEDPEEKEGAGEEEEDDGGITMSDEESASEDEPKGAGGGTKAKKVARIIERFVKLRRPGGVFVRADFGAERDPNFDKEGVRLASVYAGSLAHRSGFRDGDVVVQVGAATVKGIHDVERYFATLSDGKPFRFEEDPDGEPVEFTVRQQNKDGTFQPDRTVSVKWKPVRSSRVDARWDKAENTLHVLANKVSGFTLYFTDDLIEPGKEFHLFINDVPYQDLLPGAQPPDDPKEDEDSDARYRSRRKRAKVEGWKPEIRWALEEFFGSWDRRQVYGARRSFDLTKMREGFAKAQERAKREDDLGDRVRKAYEEFRNRAKG